MRHMVESVKYPQDVAHQQFPMCRYTTFSNYGNF